MRRIRWYHFYFLLALFDVVVIMLSLELHRRSVESVRSLMDAMAALDERTFWVRRAQQAVVELNNAGNNLLHTRNVEAALRRFGVIERRMQTLLASAPFYEINAEPLADAVKPVFREVDAILDAFGAGGGNSEPDSERGRAATAAAQRRLNDAQGEAQRCLALLAAPIESARIDLLQTHEHDLQQRMAKVHYFVAAVVAILAGALWFGRRLQQADRALEAERRRVEEERRERLAVIGELCSSVAHGIRNPLAAMRSSAQLALELGKVDDDTRQRLGDILSEGQRLGNRVTRLLNFARARVERFERIELRSLLEGAIRELEAELGRRGLRVERGFPQKTIAVEAHRDQMQQAVIELLSNAMDQSKPGDMIRVTCQPPNSDGMAEFAVEDQGPGVAPEVRERVFDLFFTTKRQGTGIGLATVRRIAREHGGDVSLSCPEGGGARFVVSIPTVRDGARARDRRV